MTRTGSPSRVVGGNCHWRAASTAALCNSGWPEIARADEMIPCSLIITSTETAPLTFAALAIAGYTGFTLFIAEDISTPPALRMVLTPSAASLLEAGGGVGRSGGSIGTTRISADSPRGGGGGGGGG